MSKGNHFSDSSPSPAGRRLGRHWIWAALVLLLALGLTFGGATGAFAALKDTTSSVKEQYETASVTCEVAEDFTVKNTGNIPALIRVSVVVNRVNEAGNVIPDTEGLPSVTPADGWMELDGYLYCKTIVQPGAAAPAPVNLSAGEGVQVVILAEAIQATPAEALAEAWGAVYEAGSWSAAEP